MSLGDVAASLPWPVFPCDGNKRPIVATGYKAATRDHDTIIEQFSRPNAVMIAVPTGSASGLIVIDIDTKNGARGQEWLDEHSDALPPTRTHRTRSGGLHLVFRAPDGIDIRNSASRIAPGVDVRGNGGYVIIPPSPSYVVADDCEPAEMPRWLIRACLPQDEPKPAPAPSNGNHEKYVQRAIDLEVASVVRAAEGTRNDTLHRAAVKLGTLVGAGALSRADAEVDLTRAGIQSGLPSKEVLATVKSGLDFGASNPRQMPERREPPAGLSTEPPPVDEGYYAALEADLPVDEPPEIIPPRQHPPHPTGPIRLTWFYEIEAALDAEDFVQGLLIARSAAVVYGESNSGKTFWTTDLGLHVAAGMAWNGKRVEQGGVVYAALEGGIGFRNRVTAWKHEHNLDDHDLPFAAIQQPLNLRDPAADVDALIEAVLGAQNRMTVPLRLIVIDTLSRALAGGNENAPDDMGALVMCMDMIRQRTGAAVLFIHHSGKDAAKGARGHSLLRAAVDTEIEIAADGGTHTASVVKQRELRKGDVFAFTLRVVELGQNRHGEAVTTCVVEHRTGDGPSGFVNRPRFTGHAKRALDVLTDLTAVAGREGDVGVPSGCRSVPEKWWRDRFYDQAMPGAEQEAKKRAFRRCADALISARTVGMASGRVWIV